MSLFTYTQNFDGLSTGNLSGQDSWTYNAGAQPQVQTTVVESSPNGISGALNSNVNTSRDITAVTTDGALYYFSLRVDNVATVDNMGLAFNAGATGIAVVYMNAPNAGDIGLRDPLGGAYTTLQTGASANTWYRIGVEFDFTNDRVRANINNGAMSAWRTMTAFSQVDRLIIEGNNGDGATTTGYWDNFSPTYAVGGGFTPTPLMHQRLMAGGVV